MVNLFQINSHIISISISLGLSLIVSVIAVLNMIEQKRIGVFMPFFVFGMGLCFRSAFMFYNFFGVAVDVFYVFSFVSIVWMFLILWRQAK